MPIGALIAATAIGGIAQASAAKKAASAQAQAAEASIAEQRASTEAQIAEQRRAFEITQANLDPYRQAGNTANAAVMYELGLGARPEGYAGFQATPGYQFQLDQGNRSINALAGARGGLNSGRTLQALADYNQGLASQEYGNFYNRLAGLQGIGANAAAGVGSAAQNTAGNVGNALQNRTAGITNAYGDIGNARASGAIGGANALSGAINNGIGIWAYQQGLGGGNRAQINVGRPGGLFGGNSWG